jgi:hypothetical protein
VETRFPDEDSVGVSQTDLPLALTKSEGLCAVERWLAEARVARDTARFALPKSRLSIGAGDVVRIAGGRYRVDRVEQSESQFLEAIRVEPGVYLPSEKSEDIPDLRPFTPPVPVVPFEDAVVDGSGVRKLRMSLRAPSRARLRCGRPVRTPVTSSIGSCRSGSDWRFRIADDRPPPGVWDWARRRVRLPEELASASGLPC